MLLHAIAAQGAFVVTFGRAGEDKKFSKLGDVEATLQGFAGADYDLQVLQHHSVPSSAYDCHMCTPHNTIVTFCLHVIHAACNIVHAYNVCTADSLASGVARLAARRV